MTFKPPDPPTGCADVLTHERALTSIAELLESKARALLDEAGGSRIGLASATQAALAATRARKLAAELATRREDHARVDYLLEEVKRMNGGSTVQRPRLRMVKP